MMPPTIIRPPPTAIPRWKPSSAATVAAVVDLLGLRRRQPAGVGRGQRIGLGVVDRPLPLGGQRRRPRARSSILRPKLTRDQGAEHGDREQAGDPRDAVVDPRGDADVALLDRVERGRRQRRDGRREAEPEQEEAGQHVGHVVRARRRPGAAAAARARRRSARSTSAAAARVPVANFPNRGESTNRSSEIGRGREPGLERRVARRLLEEEGDEEEAPRSARRRRSASRCW